MGDSKSPMYFIAIACAANIGLDYLFLGAWKMGAAGAALSTLLTEFLVLVVQTFFLKDHLGKVIRGVKALPIILSAAVSTGAGIVIQHYMGVSNSFLRLVIGAVSFFGIYFVLLLILKEKFLTESLTLALEKLKSLLSSRKQQPKD